MGDRDILKLETKVADLQIDRTSSSGNPYTAVVLPSGDWVFAWEGAWKDELDQNAEIYQDLEVEIYCVDKEDDPDDHFYNLKAIVPEDPEIAGKLLQDKIDRNEPELTEEEKNRLREEVKEMYS